MHRANKFVALAASALLPVSAFAAGDDGGNGGNPDRPDYSGLRNLTITEVVVASGGEFDNNKYDFDILLNAVLAAGLEGALGDPDAELTVYAPTDIAFIRTAHDLGYTGSDEAGAFNFIVGALTELGGGDPIPVLTDILLYHVSPGLQWKGKLKYSGGTDTLLGATILPVNLRLVDNDPDLHDPSISSIGDNIRVANGLIHKINRVLIPIDIENTNDADLPTITELVVASGGEFDDDGNDYDLLLNAVLAAGLADALNDPNDSLTVLAPNDAAFMRTAKQLGFTGSGEEEAFAFIVAALDGLSGGDPIALLTEILLYHVVPGGMSAKDVLLGGEMITAQGGSFEPKPKSRRLIDNFVGTTNPKLLIYRSDNRVSNGFVHTISHVLIPVNLNKLP